jgi:hypothetical protein
MAIEESLGDFDQKQVSGNGKDQKQVEARRRLHKAEHGS